MRGLRVANFAFSERSNYLEKAMPLSVSAIALSVFAFARTRQPPLLCSVALSSARAPVCFGSSGKSDVTSQPG